VNTAIGPSAHITAETILMFCVIPKAKGGMHTRSVIWKSAASVCRVTLSEGNYPVVKFADHKFARCLLTRDFDPIECWKNVFRLRAT
jgi:hypothetical protein